MPVNARGLDLPASTAVVGSNGAIGSAVVTALHAEGVVVHGFDIAEPAVGAPTRTFTPLPDGSAEEYLERFAERVDELRPASLVIASGIYPARRLEDESVDSLLEILAVNAVVPAMLVRSFGDGARDAPTSVVVTSSLAALRARVGTAAYSTSKAALERLVQALVVEYRDRGVRINLIRPGYVSSRSALNPIPDSYDARMKSSEASSDPDDLVEAYLWLLSGNSRQLNGSALDVDRGMHLGSVTETAWL